MSAPFTIHDAHQRLRRSMARARAVDDPDLIAATRTLGAEFLRLVVTTARMVRFHDLGNAAVDAPLHETADALRALLGRVGVSLVSVGDDQITINDVPVKMPGEGELATELARMLQRHLVGGLIFRGTLDLQRMRTLLRLLSGPQVDATAPRAALRAALSREGVTHVELLAARRFIPVRERDPETGDAVRDVTSVAARAVATTWREIAAGRMARAVPALRALAPLVERDEDSADRAAGLLAHDQLLAPHVRHGVQVAALAVLIGRELGLDASLLGDLAVCAALHDIGYVAAEKGSPPPFERHGSAGARRLLAQRGFHDARVRRMQVCMEHHWRADDPRKPSLFARIVHIADDFDTLTRIRPGGALLPAPHALAGMWAARGGEYDDRLLQLFANRVGAFPPGSLLALDDGSLVVVISGVRSPESFASPLTMKVRGAAGEAVGTLTYVDLAAGGTVREVLTPSGG